MAKAINKILDAIDLETYIVCKDENDGKRLALELGRELNLGEIDIMYFEFDGYGARVRLRKYIHKPGDYYNFLEKGEN